MATSRRSIDPNLTVDQIMRRWPGTMRVMIRRGVLCIGCPIGIFHTLADVCLAHGIDPDAFMAELLDTIGNDPADPRADEH